MRFNMKYSYMVLKRGQRILWPLNKMMCYCGPCGLRPLHIWMISYCLIWCNVVLYSMIYFGVLWYDPFHFRWHSIAISFVEFRCAIFVVMFCSYPLRSTAFYPVIFCSAIYYVVKYKIMWSLQYILFLYVLDINECTGTHPCHANASCKNVEGSFVCSCTNGFSGDGMNCSG